MKVYPVGARILPKTASAGSTQAASGSPVFMVATSVSQNLMRVGKTNTQTVTLTSGQRVVTVNTASLRPQSGLKTASTAGAITSAIKTLQPRVVSSSGGLVNKVSKPSVIVVQRSQTGATKTLVSKDGISAASGSTRILQTKPAKQPIVIVSKSTALAATSSAESPVASVSSTVTTQATNASSNQNVIVLDLSEQQQVQQSSSTSIVSTAVTGSTTSTMSNNVLSDILQMTGIMAEDDSEPMAQEPSSEPMKCTTTTLQKVPGDSASWIVLDSNGSKSNEESIKEPKLDIFSQAMASAEIGDFAENNIEEIKDSEPPLVPPKSNSNASILFASPHDVMPSRQKIEEDMGPIFSENHHDKSVIVEQVGDEIIPGEEIVGMDDEFTS